MLDVTVPQSTILLLYIMHFHFKAYLIIHLKWENSSTLVFLAVTLHMHSMYDSVRAETGSKFSSCFHFVRDKSGSFTLVKKTYKDSPLLLLHKHIPIQSVGAVTLSRRPPGQSLSSHTPTSNQTSPQWGWPAATPAQRHVMALERRESY